MNHDYYMERIDFLVNAAFDNDNGTGKSFEMAIGLIQRLMKEYKEEIIEKEETA